MIASKLNVKHSNKLIRIRFVKYIDKEDTTILCVVGIYEMDFHSYQKFLSEWMSNETFAIEAHWESRELWYSVRYEDQDNLK